MTFNPCPKPQRKPKTKARKTYERALADAKAREKASRSARANKYGAQRTPEGFDSKLEAAVYSLLCLRAKAGEIRSVRRQVAVELTAACIRSKIDFGFEYPDGSPGYAEAKGVSGERWTIWLKLYREYGTAPLELWKGDHREPRLVEVVRPKGEK